MKCNLFTKTSPQRIYLNGIGEKTFVTVSRNGTLRVDSASPDKAQIITTVSEHIKKHLPQLPLSATTLFDVLKGIPEITMNNGATEAATPRVSEVVGSLKMENIRYKADTLDRVHLSVDHREPEELKERLGSLPLPKFSVETLPLGDIRAVCENTGAELIIERKTTADLRVSITKSDRRAHSQTERLHTYQQEKAAEGILVKVIWIIEGPAGVYGVLPNTNQMAGWVNYQCAISEQYIVESFSTEMTAYLAAKFIQGFFERELTIKIRIGGKEIGHSSDAPTSPSLLKDRGVTHAHDFQSFLMYMPGVSRKNAEAIAEKAKNLVGLVNLSEEELIALPGVGPKTAQTIKAFVTGNNI